ncbi:MAG: hypothetical protein ACK4MY_03345 [Brevundimonas sp.]
MAMTDGASSIDHDPVAEEAAYAALGRLLVTWAMVDQTVIRALWRRDKAGAFPPAVPATFPARWLDWSPGVQDRWPDDMGLTWEEFELQQAEAVAVRNALAHWTVDVEGHDGRFSIAVHPHEPAGWRPSFKRWWKRVQHMPLRLRHPGPANGRGTRWSDWQLRQLQERWTALLILTRLLAEERDLTTEPEAFAALARHNSTLLAP